MNLMHLCHHLEQAQLGKVGTSIFLNMIPINVNKGILLRNPLVGTRIDYELSGHINTEFQVIVRTTSYEHGEELMNKVFAALTLDQVAVGDLFVSMCYPQFQPVVYPLSDGNLLELSTDFTFVGHVEK